MYLRIDDKVPKFLDGVEGYYIEYYDKPRFFSCYCDKLKVALVDDVVLRYYLASSCHKIMSANRVSIKLVKQNNPDLQIHWWCGPVHDKRLS